MDEITILHQCALDGDLGPRPKTVLTPHQICRKLGFFVLHYSFLDGEIEPVQKYSQTSVPKLPGSQTVRFLTKLFTEKMPRLSNSISDLDSLPNNPFTLIPA